MAQNINVRISQDFEETKKEFDKICQENCINQSDLIRKLIKDWVDANKAGN